MKYFLVLFLLSYQIFASAETEEIAYIDNLRVIQNPKLNSPSYIPKDFIPEKSTLLKYFELDINSVESGLFLNTEIPQPELSSFYEAMFKKNDWRIFRKDETENNLVYQVENISKRVISIIIKKENKFSNVKIFYKRQR